MLVDVRHVALRKPRFAIVGGDGSAGLCPNDSTLGGGVQGFRRDANSMVDESANKGLWPLAGRRLVGALGLMLVLCLAVDALALMQLLQARAQLEEIVDDNLVRIELNHRMKEAVSLVSRLVPEMVLLSKPGDLAIGTLEVARARQQYDTAWSDLQALPLTEPGRARRVAILDASQRARQRVDEVIGLARANRDAEALALLRAQAIPAVLAWQETIDDKISDEAADSAVRHAAASGHFRNSMALLAGASLLTLGAGLLVGWQSVRQKRRDGVHRAELEQALAAAEQADRDKGTFLAHLSHEIRTPLSGILGVADMLWRSSLDVAQRKYVGTMRQAARSLMALLNDILDLSKALSGRLELEQRHTDLRRLLQGSVDLMEPGAAKKGLELSLDIADAVETWVTCDPLRLQQVVNNLLSNAIKFTDKGQVCLSLRPVPASGLSAIQFCVRDTGQGIAPQAAKRLFLPFSQADRSTARKSGGSGLGLAIAKRLVQAMGGTLTLDSTIGVGSSFSFTLALPAAPPALRHAHAPESGFAGLGEPAVDAGRVALSVLLVEDDPVNQMVGQGLLEQLGHQVQLAGDGLQAVRMADERAYDLILMDCHLPLLDGFEATRRIRQIELRRGGKRQTIVALTATASHEDRRRCRDVGMDDVLLKPFTAAGLERVLAHTASAT